jgi:magnesium chelatase subunit I
MLKILTRIVQAARCSNEINQDKGVSVRMGVHSLELLVGEAERTRSLIHDIMAVPRPCDIFSIAQSVKIELAELDDITENRTKVLKNLISDAMKETSLEYLTSMDSSVLDSIKEEFMGKSFQVSQTILGSNSMQTSYYNQLKNFNSLLNLITGIYQKVMSDQEDFVKETEKYEIYNNNLIISESSINEIKAGIVELVLDGLCWIEPKILDRKEGIYVAS